MEKPTAIVRVIRPKLTEEERERRMERIKRAAVRFLLAVWVQEDAKKLKEDNQ